VFVRFVEKTAPQYFTEQEIAILTIMFFSTSYIIGAETLKMSQVKVSVMFDRCIKKLKKEKIWEVYEIFYTVKSNLNIVKRTYRRKGVVLDEPINC